MTICNLTAQQLRRAAAIKDEIAELTKTLMEIVGEPPRVCAQVEVLSAKTRKTVRRKPRIALPIAPALSNTTGELPLPTPEQVPNQAPQITEEQHPVPTTHVTDGSHPALNGQLTVEQHQTPVVYVTEGQQETPTVTATITETATNQENQASSVPAAAPIKWEIGRA